jgi:hypothetical protein
MEICQFNKQRPVGGVVGNRGGLWVSAETSKKSRQGDPELSDPSGRGNKHLGRGMRKGAWEGRDGEDVGRSLGLSGSEQLNPQESLCSVGTPLHIKEY